MADLAYTTADRITKLVGQLGVDLRTDDADATELLDEAVDFASSQIDYYCWRFDPAELAANRWVAHVATWIGTRWLCSHRLNETPASIQKEWDETLKPQLEDIREGKATVPRASVSRRPGTVTNRTEDLRRYNGQTRVNGPMSTGAGSGYPRPRDETAPPVN